MVQELYTARGAEISDTPWDVYPRPLMRRNSYVNLNGIWDFKVSEGPELPKAYDQTIRVPFCPESLLSGNKQTITPCSYLFYRREIRLPEDFRSGRVLLHVGAADQVASIYVNQKQIAVHEGGYTAFEADITDALEQTNELVIRCQDDLRDTKYPYGKQSLNRGGMWYTPVSGIWQTVWLECVPQKHIQGLDIQVDTQCARVSVRPVMDGKLICQGREYPLVDGQGLITPEQPRLWSPEDPWLYEFTVETEEDRVESYFALRTIEAKEVDGIPRLCLNGKPYFFHGLLDQGYWPDGIYTPADPRCYADDILEMKKLGFNTLRKHIKVEAGEFYYQCDRLGMVVFQDMVNNGEYNYLRDTVLPTIGIQKLPERTARKNGAASEAFILSMRETVAQLKNYPCILYWTVFNEGWGQFDADSMYRQLRNLDHSRIIDATSGWFRKRCSDVDSYHIYNGRWGQLRPSQKPVVLSEFGGYTCGVEGHMTHPEKIYGYKSCGSPEGFQSQIEKLYRRRILPAVSRGLCAAIITQVSDVEEEINGFLTYDRKVVKADAKIMEKLSRELQEALAQPPAEKPDPDHPEEQLIELSARGK